MEKFRVVILQYLRRAVELAGNLSLRKKDVFVNLLLSEFGLIISVKTIKDGEVYRYQRLVSWYQLEESPESLLPIIEFVYEEFIWKMG